MSMAAARRKMTKAISEWRKAGVIINGENEKMAAESWRRKSAFGVSVSNVSKRNENKIKKSGARGQLSKAKSGVWREMKKMSES
jgi:hypothetical protein